jgi:hypothetical protein
MWIFSRPIDELRDEDIQGLMANRVREGVALEFKRDMYGGRDEDIREMLRDVASIANAEGGVLVIGIDEDGEGAAVAIKNVPNSENQASRLIASCGVNISDRIPGLRAVPLATAGGEVVVVDIPRSYRKPHMITFRGATDFWIRHDRQKARMSIAEIRTAISTTEELGMKVEAFVERRRLAVSSGVNELLFVLMATPLLLEDGRVDALNPKLKRLLQNAPSYRSRVGAATLASHGARIEPTLNGVRAVEQNFSRLEVFRNGHVEFVVMRSDSVVNDRGQDRWLRGWVVAELVRNFVHLIIELRRLTDIVDPYVFTVSVWYCRGVAMPEQGGDRWGIEDTRQFDEASRDLFLDPVGVVIDEQPDATAQRILDRFWNAFHFAKCPFFKPGGEFCIPDR